MTDQPTRYTLTEAARLTGLSTEALRLRIRRGKLLAEKGNDGLRVFLTSADIEAIVAGQERQQIPTDRTQSPNAIKALEDAIGLLREQFGQDRTALETAVLNLKERAERAETQATVEQARADRAEVEREAARAEIAVERARTAQAEQARESAKVAAAAAEGEAKGLRLALEEARRPFWRRWIG
jgi:chromosome segregation ATPase